MKNENFEIVFWTMVSHYGTPVDFIDTRGSDLSFLY